MTSTQTVDIRRADDRFHTRIDWLDSRHSFSFGPHRDPRNVNHGLLIVSNDDVVAPGGGFGRHPHNDMEIVTWVLQGELEHRDSAGNHGVIYPGLAQRMSAGTGIWHSEMNASATEPVHFVQMWVVPDTVGVEPGYQQTDVNEALESGELVVVASGSENAAITINQADATMRVARLQPGGSVTLPDNHYVHVFVARGQGELAGADAGTGSDSATRLLTGDAARITAVRPPAALTKFASGELEAAVRPPAALTKFASGELAPLSFTASAPASSETSEGAPAEAFTEIIVWDSSLSVR